MGALFGILVLAAVAAAIFAFNAGREQGRREAGGGAAVGAGDNDNAPDIDDEADPGQTRALPAPDDAGRTQELYAISGELGDGFWSAARPNDLRRNEFFKKGVALLRGQEFSDDDLAEYFCGDSAIIASLAAEAMHDREVLGAPMQRVASNVGTVAAWPLYFALHYLANTVPAGDPIIGRVMARTLDYHADRQSRMFIEEFVETRLKLGETPRLGPDLEGLTPEQIKALTDFLGQLDSPGGTALVQQIDDWRAAHINQAFLRSIGTIWDAAKAQEANRIVLHARLVAAAGEAEALVRASKPRSVLLVGEEGLGKRTIILQLARRLYDEGWVIFEAGHAELIAGQTYIGEYENRLQSLLRQLRGGRRILWIVPNFADLAFSGVHRYNPVSALDILLPDIANGDITIASTASPGAYERLLQSRPTITATISVQRLALMPAGEAKQIAVDWLTQRIGADAGHSAAVEEAWELTQQFLSTTAAPGNILKLLDLTRERLMSEAQRPPVRLHIDDVIATLASLTGLPLTLLDERQRLDVDELRATFERNVLGQAEAVDCLVERVAMIKAGVTDPSRPAGVFLFAGPTGTGKTEIAKTLASWLFGSADRMIRLDMSELQTPSDLERIVGKGDEHDAEALANRIREQPFAIVLLDEFEKAHPQVWDLFLQVFDDGRLTTRRGQTADFRQAIIILTSNLGSVVQTTPPIGFSARGQDFDSAAVHKSVEISFRKEFINRLDRVVVFRPLTRDLMRRILEKELGMALKRRGLRSRPWAMEWDDSAIEYLLEKGFTPDLGARPLKRAIDRFLLSPLAMAIVNHKVPAGDQFLFVSRGTAGLDVQFVDPDAPDEGNSAVGKAPRKPAGTPSLKGIALAPAGHALEIAFLRERFEALYDLVTGTAWKGAKADAIGAMQDTAFWSSPTRFAVLDMIERRDRIESGMKRAGSLLERLAGGSRPARVQYPEHLVALMAQNLLLLEVAIADIEEDRTGDAFISIALGHDNDAGGEAAAAFARDLAKMYLAWAKKRRMNLTVLSQGDAGNAADYRWMAAVRGFGAHTILAAEQGLHVLELPKTTRSRFDRLTAAVKVAPYPGSVGASDRAGLIKEAEREMADVAATEMRILRRYRKEPSPLVRDAVSGWRTGRLDQVLAGDFDLMEPDAQE